MLYGVWEAKTPLKRVIWAGKHVLTSKMVRFDGSDGPIRCEGVGSIVVGHAKCCQNGDSAHRPCEQPPKAPLRATNSAWNGPEVDLRAVAVAGGGTTMRRGSLP